MSKKQCNPNINSFLKNPIKRSPNIRNMNLSNTNK